MYKQGKFVVETLGDGTEVLLRTITPHVQNVLSKRVQDKLPPKPEIPTRQMTNAGGGVEEIAVGRDEPEYIEWLEKLKGWIEEKSKIEDTLAYDNFVNVLDYCIVGWRKGNRIIRFMRRLFPLSIFWEKLDLWWHYDVSPSEWIPHPLETEGKMKEWTMRQFYIISQLLPDPTKNDIDIVANAAWGYKAPVTGEEVESQRGGFRDGGGTGEGAVGGSD